VSDAEARAFLAEHPEFNVLPPEPPSTTAQQGPVVVEDDGAQATRVTSPDVLMAGQCDTSGGLACHGGLVYLDTPDFAYKMFSGEVSVGRFDILDQNGQPYAHRYGAKADVNVLYTRFGNDAGVSFDAYGPRASAEVSSGTDGISLSAGASVVGADVTVGSGPDPESPFDLYAHFGLSLGVSLGGRLHYGDIDNDGAPEVGVGVDVGPLSADVKVEVPIPHDTVYSLGNIGGAPWGVGALGR
jgi:hypothetical protein